MNNIVQDKMLREIMVVPNNALFKDIKRETKFYRNEEVNFEEIILEKYEFMVRGKAEENTSYKQPIPYAVLLDSDDNIFVYKRWWAGSNAWEARLHQKIAIWLGGHIEREDEDSENLLLDACLREVEEEVNIEKKFISEMTALWYINDETSEVSQVHIWICYILKTSSINYELLDWEINNWEFVSFERLIEMHESSEYDLENWSAIVIDFLKDYLVK